LDSLLHEWAHVLAWFAPDGEEEHGEHWGLAYGKIYRAFVAWDYGRAKEAHQC